MEVLYPHCADLDVHKETVTASVRHMTDGTVKREPRTFKTMTTDLLALSQGPVPEGCTRVAMERPTSIGSRSVISHCLARNVPDWWVVASADLLPNEFIVRGSRWDA